MIDKLGWICVRDRKFLGARSFGKEMIYLPGGKREPGESDLQALLREIEEEISVKLLAGSVKLAEIFHAPAHGKPAGTMVQLTCYFGDFEGELSPSAEIEELVWLSSKDRDRSSAATILVMDWLIKLGLID